VAEPVSALIINGVQRTVKCCSKERNDTKVGGGAEINLNSVLYFAPDDVYENRKVRVNPPDSQSISLPMISRLVIALARDSDLSKRA
jgi:hypothetical protein